MIPQIEQLQRILNKILLERYSEIKNINVFEHKVGENSEVYVLIASENGDNEKLIKSEVGKIAKLVSIPLSDVLVLPIFMVSRD